MIPAKKDIQRCIRHRQEWIIYRLDHFVCLAGSVKPISSYDFIKEAEGFARPKLLEFITPNGSNQRDKKRMILGHIIILYNGEALRF